MNYYFLKFNLTSIGIYIAAILFFRWLFILKKKKKLSTKELIFSILLILLCVWVNSFDEQMLDRIFDGRIRFAPSLWIDTSVIIGLAFTAKILTPLICLYYILNKSGKTHQATNEATNNQVEDFVKKVFTNEKFYTAFSVTLPKGEEDKDLGLDYIPFILQNIENKRKRFKDSSNRFLITTLALGFSFIIIAIYFGYILLNDSSVGISKSVRELKTEMATANENLSQIQDKDIEQTLFTKYALNLNQVSQSLSEKGTVSKPGIYYFLNSIAKFRKDKNFELLFNATKNTLDSLGNNINTNYGADISKVKSQLENYKASLDYAKANYNLATQELISIFPKIHQEIESPKNQLSELIKRLILSIVIISFFLAILRYVAKLYTNTYNLMIQAENEDLAIRKFYVALKNTDKNQDERKIVIENLLDIIKPRPQPDSSDLNLSKDETGIIKTILNNMLKKL